MTNWVDITFECLPLRSVTRFDVPLDAPPAYEAFVGRVREAAEKHGSYNTYYLHNARCVFHLTNDEQVGMVEYSFEGAVLTDPDDQHTLSCDLQAELRRDTCDWLTALIVQWLGESVGRAVQVEFDRYISAGDLAKTVRRIEKLQAESDSHGGYIGMGL